MRVVQAALYLNNADHLVSGVGHQARSVRSHIAEALHDHARTFARQAQLLYRFVAHDHDAAPGGFAAAARPADVDRLPGNYRGDGLPHVHGIGVHHPGHDLFVGIHVGRGNIFFRADEFDQFSGVAASHAFQFTHRHFVRIANDAALGAAERNIHHGTFPGHPAGQGANLVQGDIGRITNSALGRAACDGVLHTESGENFQLAIVHHDRNVNDDFASGITQNLHNAFVQVELVRGQIETRRLRLPRIGFLSVRGSFQRHSLHDGWLRNWVVPDGTVLGLRTDKIKSISRLIREGKRTGERVEFGRKSYAALEPGDSASARWYNST